MLIDNDTELIIVNKHTKQYPEIRLVSFFTKQTNFEGNIRPVMIDPNTEYDYFVRVLKHERVDPEVLASDMVRSACLYLVACCFIGKTDNCKPLLENILDLYRILIYDPKASKAYGDSKEILHYLVESIADNYNDQLEKIAKDLRII